LIKILKHDFRKIKVKNEKKHGKKQHFCAKYAPPQYPNTKKVFFEKKLRK
jgi:hypothetical protein